jgi:hypothetical protein
MSYLGILSFDIANGTRDDYQNAYVDVRRIGFSTTVTSSQGTQITLPTTTCVGEFPGSQR